MKRHLRYVHVVFDEKSVVIADDWDQSQVVFGIPLTGSRIEDMVHIPPGHSSIHAKLVLVRVDNNWSLFEFDNIVDTEKRLREMNIETARLLDFRNRIVTTIQVQQPISRMLSTSVDHHTLSEFLDTPGLVSILSTSTLAKEQFGDLLARRKLKQVARDTHYAILDKQVRVDVDTLPFEVTIRNIVQCSIRYIDRNTIEARFGVTIEDEWAESDAVWLFRTRNNGQSWTNRNITIVVDTEMENCGDR